MWENIEKIKEIISQSSTKTEVLNKLGLSNNGGNYNTLSHFMEVNEIDYKHFKPKKRVKNLFINYDFYKDINNILVKNSIYKSTSNLKKRLYKEGLKERKCEMCGQGEEWMGKKMSLILDHINGDRFDNRLENLRIVCPNCNATLETHCRGKNKSEYNEKSKKCENLSCNNMIRKKNNFCINCWKKIRRGDIENDFALKIISKSRKVERPPYEQLLNEIKELGYKGTGRKYGVSDNAIRKWIKYYEKNK